MHPNAAADDRPEIYRALARMRDATGLPLTFGGEVGAGRQVKLSQIAGPNTGALRGVSLEYGRGLGGKAVAQRRPVVVDDYVRSPGISHHYDHIIVAEGLRAMVAVPVVVTRTVRGVLYGALRSSMPLGDRVVQSVVEAARELEQSLAVRDEVTRRLAWLDRYDATDCNRPHWELVREAYAELRILTQDVDDPVLRDRVRAVCETLSAVTGRPRRRDTVPELSAREARRARLRRARLDQPPDRGGPRDHHRNREELPAQRHAQARGPQPDGGRGRRPALRSSPVTVRIGVR
ncbi:GAF domain-containing protein [Amycolatopsis nalaikhensis]|uniref:GAF domain-containing protein n=1 Tax=Amycolatopsis nalaikhensis TaxID=715472 RepID=UPI003DA0E434